MSDNNQSRTGCGGRIVNALTFLVVIAAIVAIGVIAFIFFTSGDSESDSGPPTPTLAQVAQVPTLTQTPTPAPEIESGGGLGGGLPATSTPILAQPTTTPVPINTLRPTLTPSITPTFPPPTPTRTPTPTPTDTPTPGPTPTATNTRSPFPFTKDLVSPQYLQNYANNAGCNWLGIAGEVFDLNGNPVPAGQYQVHIWESGIDTRVPVGGAPAYGPSGYEQFLFDAPRVQDQNLQLETVNGTAVSQVFRVQTRASCNQNLLLFDFLQNH